MKIKIIYLTSILLAMVLTLTACASPTPTSAVQTASPTKPFPSETSAVTQTSPPATATSEPTATSTTAPTLTPTVPAPTENPIHSLGQPVKVGDVTLALIGVTYTPTQLQVTFVAKNYGTAAASVNFIDFSASGAAGTSKLSLDACYTPAVQGPPDYAVPSLAGSMQPGENVRGAVCWKSADPKSPPLPQTGIQVSYIPEGSNKTAGIWDVSSAGTVDAPAALAASDFATPPHQQGEAVTLKDITMIFDGVTFQGVGQDKTRVVMTHFTLVNNGSASYKFGEFLSYSFSLKLADGSPLGTDFMTVGCQNTASKVEVAPGQKRSITICFVDPGTSTLAPGSLAIFTPNLEVADKVFWETK